jgi:GTP cyclohydrolase I
VTECLERAVDDDQGAAPRLHVLPADAVDIDAATRAMSAVLSALGQDTNSEELRDTPRRAAAALAEMLSPTPFVLTTFANEAGYDEMVIARDIPFHSLCAHHVLPFVGSAHVAYVPDRRIAGLSKLARLVECFSSRLQTQERLTAQIAGALHDALAPRGVGVLLVGASRVLVPRRPVIVQQRCGGVRGSGPQTRGVCRPPTRSGLPASRHRKLRTSGSHP